jgi:hypothetical protein
VNVVEGHCALNDNVSDYKPNAELDVYDTRQLDTADYAAPTIEERQRAEAEIAKRARERERAARRARNLASGAVGARGPAALLGELNDGSSVGGGDRFGDVSGDDDDDGDERPLLAVRRRRARAAELSDRTQPDEGDLGTC